MATKIDTVSARDRLKPRREPYWHRVSKGCYVGFRKMTAGSEGTWVARAWNAAHGKQEFRALGDFTPRPAHERFDRACRAAQDWFEHLGRGGFASVTTVRDACTKYVAHLRETRTARAADDAEKRFAAYVLPHAALADMELSKLTPAHIEAWRKALRDTPTRSGPRRGERRSDSTLNRDVTCFRAALNLAFADGHVTTDFAWRGKLVPIKNADRRRELYLDRAQRRALIDHAAPDLAAFLRGLSLLPLRPGALAALTVGDYDRRLKVLKIGKDKHGQDRKIKLPATTAAVFDEAVEGKLPAATLLARADGRAWDKDAWKGPVKAAAKAAGLPSATATYSIRHSVITDLVHGGLDLLSVAQLAGTSVVMIQEHYGHLRSEIAASALEKLVL